MCMSRMPVLFFDLKAGTCKSLCTEPGVRITRRALLQKTGRLTAALALRPAGRQAPTVTVRPALDPAHLEPFVDPLPIPQIARPSGQRPSPSDPALSVPYYRLAMRAIESQVHRDLKPTPMWAFDSSSPGPTFETRSGQGLLVEWSNQLPLQHFLPIDRHIHGAESDKPEVRAVVHLHGARTSPESDGYPEDWYEPGKSALYYYPNNQDAAQLWYHDHTHGNQSLEHVRRAVGRLHHSRRCRRDALGLPAGYYEVPFSFSTGYLPRRPALLSCFAET